MVAGRGKTGGQGSVKWPIWQELLSEPQNLRKPLVQTGEPHLHMKYPPPRSQRFRGAQQSNGNGRPTDTMHPSHTLPAGPLPSTTAPRHTHPEVRHLEEPTGHFTAGHLHHMLNEQQDTHDLEEKGHH